MIIAIDGPAGSGKGTIASLVSKKLNLVNIDTGATYRCVALEMLKEGVSLEETDKIIEISKNVDINLTEDSRVFLNKEDVTDRIREKDVTKIVSQVSSIEKVRENLVALQRNMAKGKNVIMEGRDITTVVFPNADFKFYLDASLDERVKRRLEQNKEKGIDMSESEIRDNIAKRDYNDMHKKVGALKKTNDQIYIDTSNMTIDEVVNKIVNIVKEGVNMNIRDKYIEFFVSKGHKQIPSAPVVPENDPSVLFNTAGMQPLVPYLMGEVHPYGTRLCDYQKCIRTNDLDEVGDVTHHTFFEMLGNWSLGDYFKKESIEYSFEFLTKVLNIPIERLAVTVFKGNDVLEEDIESENYWLSHGIKQERIAKTSEDNFWSAGEVGPCGTDTEIFYFRSDDEIPETFDPEDDRWVEIWNNVFMQYERKEDGSLVVLPKKNVDTGMGLERITAVLEGVNDNYESSIWKGTIKKIEEISGKSYYGNEKAFRIIADHIKAAVFISSDPAGIKPSNTDQGYILRRLIRRAIRYAKMIDIDINSNWESEIAKNIIDEYKKYYSELSINENVVMEVLKNEKIKFNRTLEKGLREFEKIVKNLNENEINKDLAFKLYDTYGFPIELTLELAKERGLTVDEKGFYEKFKAHQELSRTASAGKFKGGLAGNSEIETKYHTATHLLNAALKVVINKDVHQKGSNITDERMRFDFSCDHKLTDEEKKAVEDLVNKWIDEGLPVTKKEMSKEEAIKSGAECMFIEKYPDIVTVYSIGDVSKELCGGPHVNNTSELGHFKIKKEEASSAGVRRIKAILEEK